ncbi:MAG: hypothetical protein DI551_11045 [Micavibrio aeruginosavorus]|uniref:Uncharacterized protein n=1 Tax=Micavibrio aeruginosavorus TaxID=349221 RepID=A0A2W5PY54_9BACT|nr:MAG: hypothetical protein DI551_11045 [Micavibrio aeruginosavorus]
MALSGHDINPAHPEASVVALKALPDPFLDKHRQEGMGTSVAFNAQNLPTPPAHRVEQGGIGFSSNVLIGTEHVANCVALVVRDPQTHKTALAHFDDTSTPESLARIFGRMPPERPLDILLIGAKYGPDVQGHDYERDSSERNLQNVLGFLAGKNVNIVGARIHDPQQPGSFVIDPKNFKLRESDNLLPNADQPFAFARKFLSHEQTQPMAVEFDFTKSLGRQPYLLNREQVLNLNMRVRGQESEAVAVWHREKGARGGFENFMAEQSRDIYLPAYDRAVEHVLNGLDGRSRYMEQMVRSLPIFIGQNAESANKPLVDYIQNGAFGNSYAPQEDPLPAPALSRAGGRSFDY